MPASIHHAPTEVLETIAFFAATDTPLGPPTVLPNLLSVNRSIYNRLTLSNNPHLYARIFAQKFDVGAAIRRFGAAELTVTALAIELKRRCVILKRIRSKQLARRTTLSTLDNEDTSALLWCAYLMMLEDDGQNVRQLRDYAKMDEWLAEYWFLPDGASCGNLAIEAGMWPPNTTVNALAMWLFWFLLQPGKYLQDTMYRRVLSILKPLALGAHKYELCRIPVWTSFLLYPRSRRTRTTSTSDPSTSCISTVSHYAFELTLSITPLAAPAILAYLSLANHQLTLSSSSHSAISPTSSTMQLTPLSLPSSHSTTPSTNATTPPSMKWDSEYIRCTLPSSLSSLTPSPSPIISQTDPISHTFPAERMERISRAEVSHLLKTERTLRNFDNGRESVHLRGVFKPGSIEGVWEGMFTYTEFTAYAALLSGAAPHVLQKSLIAQHRQTWKLREWHLVKNVGFPPPSSSSASYPPSPSNSSNSDYSHASSSSSSSGEEELTEETTTPTLSHTSKSKSKRTPPSSPPPTTPSTDSHQHNKPIPPGDPLRAYMPSNVRLREVSGGIEAVVKDKDNRERVSFYTRYKATASATHSRNEEQRYACSPGSPNSNSPSPRSPTSSSYSSSYCSTSPTSSPSSSSNYSYQTHLPDAVVGCRSCSCPGPCSCSCSGTGGEGGGEGSISYASTVSDILITGEGHSAWGQFRLTGRVRPCDGFASICKEYVIGDRGTWLYRGYLVGTQDGNLVGRWRDTLSPSEVHGYEGCFAMSRRR